MTQDLHRASVGHGEVLPQLAMSLTWDLALAMPGLNPDSAQVLGRTQKQQNNVNDTW